MVGCGGGEQGVAGTASNRSPCGIELAVSGGTFSPDVCRFEVISGGQGGSDYAIALRDSTHTVDEIDSVALFNISPSRTGAFRFDPEAGQADFKGQLIDRGAIARHLLRGWVTLEPRGNDRVYMRCDVLFDHGIRLRAEGLLDVKRVYAP